MATKIILFLSDLKEGAAEKEYLCPCGGPVVGAQTNDAPVRYLLRENPTVRQIICVVTQLARQFAWEPFQAVVHEAAPAVEVIPVDYEEQQDFGQTAIPQILPKFKSGDEIFMDLTGGFRNANMHLLLLSRVLSYCGIRTAGAVYSNFRTGRVEDMSRLFGEFDLVAGMQELTNLGSVRTLQSYYSDHPGTAPEIKALLDAMEALTEAITLCRTKRIGELMERFGAALETARSCDDPLMQQLLTAFRRIFGKKLSTPGLIKWCLRNDMLQQALTVYTERIPAHIFASGILKMDDTVQRESTLPHEDADAIQFMRGFLMLSVAPLTQLAEYVKTHSYDMAFYSLGRTRIDPPEEIRIGVENLALVASLAYPGGGGFQPTWSSRLPPEKAALAALEKRLATAPEKDRTMIGMFNLTYGKNQLRVLLGQPPVEPKHNDRIDTIEDIEQLLPRSGYSTSYPIGHLQTICRDYLYVKLLRNLANHANDEVGDEQLALADYLRGFNYPDPNAITIAELKQVLAQALAHLYPPQKKVKK